MKTTRKKKSDPARPINFSSGAVLGQFLDAFTRQKTLETRQEALRVIVRDRMNQEKATRVTIATTGEI